MFTGYDDYSGLGRVASAHWPWLGFWFLLLAPVIAGAIYGPLVYKFAPEARGHGVPEVMYAVSHRGGRIAPQVSVVKALASALCIGGGGSVGREGPIVQIGSAAGSTIAQVLRMNTPRTRLLVACGAAAASRRRSTRRSPGVFFGDGDDPSGLHRRRAVHRDAEAIDRRHHRPSPFLALAVPVRLPGRISCSHRSTYLLIAALGLIAR